ncbi:hypothetical protein FM076_01485 [Streptomyces albus subsp. chlorinus]|uniref:hypothetical protein n=1 Tax=Streptomyces albus TaxID=1888 RepID=UPI00156DBB6E|nr:hypothetical protein [Streptomyces albus]NSC19952.1 hypothetical protein [Streptomyces albus subsp. chlorinus]
MSDIFRRSVRERQPALELSNTGTAVLLDVLALAACELAETEWERRFALVCCDSRTGGGNDGFDLDELPWDREWRTQHDFLLRVVDAALSHRGWDVLPYQPRGMHGHLERFRELVAGFVPEPPLSDPLYVWEYERTEADYQRCEEHGLFLGLFTHCRLCPATTTGNASGPDALARGTASASGPGTAGPG